MAQFQQSEASLDKWFQVFANKESIPFQKIGNNYMYFYEIL